jgi:cation transport protein ChaC
MVLRAGRDLWVFGYGSLMWRPDFPFVERAQATLAGYHRAFCIASTVHRGSRERPGLVLGLDKGQACRGIAYRVAEKDAAGVLDYLRDRELIYGVYREARVPLSLVAEEGVVHVEALAYTVERCHPSYTGPMPLERQARIIRGARGRSGANLDYLINTVQHLRQLAIRERQLERLMALAAGFSANVAGDTLHRSCVAGLRREWARRPTLVPELPKGDQRRFGHRIAITSG